MTEFVNKHSLKINLTISIAVIMAVIGWMVSAGKVVASVETNKQSIEKQDARITKIEDKFDQVATRQDIENLRNDLKDYINKK